MFKDRYKAIVIGGGAAGLMAAAHIAGGGKSVLLLEKMEKPARKVRITGKGRCNLTNDCSVDQFCTKIKGGEEFVRASLDMFTPKDCIEFFEKIGVRLTVERGGRVFPSSMKAAEIADKLESFAKRNGAEIVCRAKVVSLIKSNNKVEGVEVEFAGEIHKVYGDNVLVATGGLSYASTGSSGDGYHFAHDTGHHIEAVRPSLTPLLIECRELNKLDRLLLKNINLSLLVDGKEVDSQFGELEFFSYGIGGAATLKMSRMAVDALIDGAKVEVLLDLKPALSVEKLKGRFRRELEADSNLTLSSFLRKLMPKPMVELLIGKIKRAGGQRCQNYKDSDIEYIISHIKAVRFNVYDYGDFSKAIVTAGGVSTAEVDQYTMESISVKRLFFIGELLDIDADTGGYNLQMAFSTAFAAAQAII